MKRLLFFLILALSAHGQILSGIVGASSASGPTYIYYGYGCNGTSTNTCTVGASTIAQNTSPFNSYGTKITTGANVGGYTVATVGSYYSVKGANGHFNFALYTDSGGLLTRVANCAVTANVNIGTVPGWTEGAETGCTLAASTTYYILTFEDDATTTINFDAGAAGSFYATSVTYGTWGATYGDNALSSNISHFIKVTAN